jgi:hypothetical protein
MDNTAAIRDVIQTYFDASYESSGEKMERVFHDAAHIYGRDADGSLRDMPKAFFVNMVAGPNPGSAPKPTYARRDEILSLDFTGEHTAVARVQLRVGNTLFTDMLCFMRLAGRWAVIAKVFSGQAIA